LARPSITLTKLTAASPPAKKSGVPATHKPAPRRTQNEPVTRPIIYCPCRM
jgi:hypothetical protein